MPAPTLLNLHRFLQRFCNLGSHFFSKVSLEIVKVHLSKLYFLCVAD